MQEREPIHLTYLIVGEINSVKLILGGKENIPVSQKIYLQFFEMRRLTSSEHAQSSRDIKCYIISSKVKGDNFRTNSFRVITFLHVCLAKI